MESDKSVRSVCVSEDRMAVVCRNHQRTRGNLRILACGLAAALPGVIAAHTTLPVIGVPINADNSFQGGTDAVKHMMEVNGNQEEILVDRDRVYQVKFE